MSPLLADTGRVTLIFEIADGICAIEARLKPGVESAHVAPIAAFAATSLLIRKCVGILPPDRGEVRDFGEWRDSQVPNLRGHYCRFCAADNHQSGGDNNLIISVSEFYPQAWSDRVRCFGSTAGPGIIESCNGLADRMDASLPLKTFAPDWLPHDYATPYTLTAGRISRALFNAYCNDHVDRQSLLSEYHKSAQQYIPEKSKLARYLVSRNTCQCKMHQKWKDGHLQALYRQ